jgi:xylan 1,4-beta-xylosidase
MMTDHRKNKNRFGGIILQEYSAREERLVGPSFPIFRGTDLGYTEGPHLYKRQGYYYLIVAEGGTGLNHAVTLARSKSLFGPYEVCPSNPILSSKSNPRNILQKSGHTDLVETEAGEVYMVHLYARPLHRPA